MKFDILSAEECNYVDNIAALKWKEFLIDEGRKRLDYKLAEKGTVANLGDIAHIVCWLGDIVYIYVEKKNEKKR